MQVKERTKTCDTVETFMEIPRRCFRFLRSATKHLKLVNQIQREKKTLNSLLAVFKNMKSQFMIQRDSFMTFRLSLVTLQRPTITKFSRLHKQEAEMNEN